MNTARTVFGAAVIGFSALAAIAPATAQDAPVNGMRPADLRAHAITNATVVIEPGNSIENATIIIRDGLISAVGPDVAVPPDARLHDGTDLTVYAGLIESAVLVKPEEQPASPGDHWNSRIRAQLSLADQSLPKASTRTALRKLGFTAAAIYPNDGIFRGSGTVVSLSEDNDHQLTYLSRAHMSIALEHGGSWSAPVYPGSLMGAIALTRQTLLDAKWYANASDVYANHPDRNEPPAPADALAALSDVIAGDQALLVDVSNEHNLLRAARIGEEFNLPMIMLGSGFEFRRLHEVSAAGTPVIVPLQFPKQPEISTLAGAHRVTLRDMQSWEQAPTNARRLHDVGVPIAFTTHRLKKQGDFHKQVRKTIEHGLTEEAALAALTTTPAELLGLDAIMGTIEPGKIANLVVLEGSLFEKDHEVRDVWINGRRHEINAPDDIVLAGKGTLDANGSEFSAIIDTTKKSFKIELPNEDPESEKPKIVKAKKVIVQRDQVAVVIDASIFDARGYARLSGVIDDQSVLGSGSLPDGSLFAFTLTITEELDDEADDDEADGELASGQAESPDAASDESRDMLSGTWELMMSIEGMGEAMPISMELELDGSSVTGMLSIMDGQMEIPLEDASFDADAQELTASVTGPDGESGSIDATVMDGILDGTMGNDMFSANFSGTRVGDETGGGGVNAVASGATDEDDMPLPPEELAFPLGAYGLTVTPTAEDLLITNATIWTASDDGIIEDGWMIVRNGVIKGLGSGSAPSANGARTINARGKHITPGLIDCHSHTGISGGVNEFAQTNTAEVGIANVINPDAIGFYRQLAGGTTAANQLHGSANPIGGQNSVVKFKWGHGATDFPIDDAIPGIKFALGENVKRSENRYPDTRMGVETFIRDAFTAAREYEQAWQRYNAMPTDERERMIPPRRDLELDTLVEILNGERLIHCHSYRQDEILSLIRIADDFGFTIGTFQHVLEGYKVADAIAEHGAGASSFSDWWAYKVEVMDAIPYNGAIMTDVGVNVSFNSDSNELARRMNTEASKAVRYGGMDPHEALKLVTLNPAMQLRIDHRVGSLENGKDADFVIWSDNPLSTYARCEQTWIEGACYFNLDRDAELRIHADAERQRLIQKILSSAHGTLKDDSDEEADVALTTPAQTVNAEWRIWALEEVRAGRDPEDVRPAECGCGFRDQHGAHKH